MTMYTITGGTRHQQFASNHGMGAFVRWVDGLSAIEYPLLAHLVEWGWVYRLPDLLDELVKAMVGITADKPLADTVAGLVRALKESAGATTVMFSNGATALEVEKDWESKDA